MLALFCCILKNAASHSVVVTENIAARWPRVHDLYYRTEVSLLFALSILKNKHNTSSHYTRCNYNPIHEVIQQKKIVFSVPKLPLLNATPSRSFNINPLKWSINWVPIALTLNSRVCPQNLSVRLLCFSEHTVTESNKINWWMILVMEAR
jgi:hypothetical protein